MSKGAIKKSTAQAICDAVKVKEGTTEGVPFKDVADRILAIPKEKPTQEKTVDITENVTVEILPDEGHTLSKVTANVNVSASGENKFVQLVNRNITTEIVEQDFEGIEKIGQYAFSKCTIEKMTIPETITEIQYYAFVSATIGCLIMPANVTLGQNVFESVKIKKMYYNGDITSWCNMAWGSRNTPISDVTDLYIKNSMGEYEQVTELVIPNGITKIAPYSFYRLKSLIKAILSAGIISIGERAFCECSNLAELTMESGVQSIGGYAFYKCNIASLTIPNSVTSIGDSAFCENRNLTQVTLSNNITTLKSHTFSYCINLRFITIPESVTTIEYNALNIGSTTTDGKATITFLGTTPPTLKSSPFDTSKIEKIIVPKGCGDAYKSATNWATYADIIEEAAE